MVWVWNQSHEKVGQQKRIFASPKTNLAPEQLLVGRIRGHVDFRGSESWNLIVGNSNLKPVTTVTSTLILQGSLNCPYWRDIFF